LSDARHALARQVERTEALGKSARLRPAATCSRRFRTTACACPSMACSSSTTGRTTGPRRTIRRRSRCLGAWDRTDRRSRERQLLAPGASAAAPIPQPQLYGY